jgi:hypothetical protein
MILRAVTAQRRLGYGLTEETPSASAQGLMKALQTSTSTHPNTMRFYVRNVVVAVEVLMVDNPLHG